jgi:hypothetical protein
VSRKRFYLFKLPFTDKTKGEIFRGFVKWSGYHKWAFNLDVDFNKHWINVFWKTRLFSFIALLDFILVETLKISTPLLIAFVINSGRIINFYYFIIGLLVHIFFIQITFYFAPLSEMTITNGLRSSVSKYFLKTDPINHSTRSSGTIISKTEKMISGFVDLYYNLVNVIGIFIAILISSISLWLFEPFYGIMAFISFCLIIFIMVLGVAYRTELTFKETTKVDDKFKSLTLESLQQTVYIRSLFASEKQLSDISRYGLKNTIYESTVWRINSYIFTIAKVLFTVIFGVVGYMILQDEMVSTADKIAVLITYYLTGNTLYSAGSVAKKIVNGVYSIEDFWKFVRDFGEQTYPVLEGDETGK